MPDDNGAHLSPHTKELGWFLADNWEVDPTVIEPIFYANRGGGRIHLAFFDHPRLGAEALPEKLRDATMLFSAYSELIDAGFVTGMNNGRLTAQLKQAASRNFLEPQPAVLSTKLRENTKAVARRLSRQILLGRLPEVFEFADVSMIGGFDVIIQSHDGDSLDDGGLTSGENPLMRQHVVDELEVAKLISVRLQGYDDLSFKIISVRPELHDAVASGFELKKPSGPITVGTVHNLQVTSETLVINNLASNPDELVAALEQRLLPFLQQNMGLDQLMLQSLHDRLEEIKNAQTEAQKKSLSDAFFLYFSRIVDGGTFLAWLVRLVELAS